MTLLNGLKCQNNNVNDDISLITFLLQFTFYGKKIRR